MIPLMQLPNGQWVAPDRVSSVEVVSSDISGPCVLIMTKEGRQIVIEAQVSNYDEAVAMRRDIATKVNEALKAADEKDKQ